MSEHSLTNKRRSDKQAVIDYFDHSAPGQVEHVAGGWWRVWNHQYFHLETSHHLTLVSEGWKLTGAAILHSDPGFTGVVLALENTDYVLDWPSPNEDPDFDPNEAQPTESLYEWAHEWMGEHPDSISERPSEPPVDIHGAPLHETCTRGDSQTPPQDEYILEMNHSGNRWCVVRITEESGDLLTFYNGQKHKNQNYIPLRDTKALAMLL